MREQFLEHIHRNTLCSVSDRILLTVSGGLDSMVMLHLFGSNGFHVSVAHCNFQLRGKESDGDEDFVAARCKHLSIPFHSKRFETNNYATQNNISTQMAARELRYAWFAELQQKEKLDLVATAHHLNDSIETVLFNLVNGRGADGLTGIAVRNGKIIRPLLFASRKEIEQYAALNGITWREDDSNQHDDYKRNFIRHRVIPKLKEVNPNLEQSVLQSMEKTRGIIELKELGVSGFKSNYVIEQGKRTAINKEAILQLSYPAGVLYELIKAGGFSLDHCNQIIPGLKGQSGKKFLSPTHQLIIDREELIITPHADFYKEVTITKEQTESSLGPWNLEIEETSDLTLSNNPFQVLLDADKVKYPLSWRPWKEGDFFYPLGMEQRKKISDFLIDQKVPLSEKSTVTVIESEGEIIWVVGYRISNRFKIASETKKAVRFLLIPYFV